MGSAPSHAAVTFGNARPARWWQTAPEDDSPIEPLPGFPEGVLAFARHGHVTKSDYDTVLVPAVKRALTAQKKLRPYYEMAADFTGLEPGAMWEDFKVGMEHLSVSGPSSASCAAIGSRR
jgi:hypothetical protein